MRQHVLRSSWYFELEALDESFCTQALERGNRGRQENLEEEMVAMKLLPLKRDSAEYDEVFWTWFRRARTGSRKWATRRQRGLSARN